MAEDEPYLCISLADVGDDFLVRAHWAQPGHDHTNIPAMLEIKVRPYEIDAFSEFSRLISLVHPLLQDEIATMLREYNLEQLAAHPEKAEEAVELLVMQGVPLDIARRAILSGEIIRFKNTEGDEE